MSLFLTPLILALAASAQDTSHSHDHSPVLGNVAFQTSCNAEADAAFQTGLGWLHSFEYEQAARVFAQAAAADPGCAIAYWGTAASYYHPLWAPPSESELDKAQAALAKARAVGAKSQRERDYISALETFYRDSKTVDHKTRALAYSAALQQLQQRYPDDHEAAVFYALSLVATGMMDKDPDFAKEKAAASILNRVLVSTPNHPGVAHYLIHSFDFPQLADLALPAARQYAGIAPGSPHAPHKPSHLLVRLGQGD
jgi:tetratricopeptide (TPR) repeat protein